ncbi:MAG: hypothetical protein IJY20_06970 [Clostridia bacterium]|nr:hypothetical protein [Clostridia bacterium]
MKRILAFLLMLVMLIGVVGCAGMETPSTGDNPGGNENQQPPAGDPPATEVTFRADFKVSGTAAELLTAALEKAGISIGGADATKTIYAGDGDATLTASAKTKATGREASYNDYAIVCDGTDLALYGASSYATEQAIAYLINTYAKDGGLTVAKDLSYTAQPTLTNITIGGYALQEMTVVAGDDSCLGIAQDTAKRLSILCGYEIPASTTAARRAIKLVADNTKNEDDFAQTYQMEVSTNPAVKISELTITAPTRAALSYAAQSMVAALKDGDTFEDGYTEEKTFNMVHTDATNTSLFKYCGTWQASDEENPTTMVSYWNAAYVEINFTGNAITPVFSRETTFKIKMDNAEEYSKVYTANGAITFFAEGDGVHTLKIFYNDRVKHMYFSGVSVCEATTLSRTPDRAHYIQFVGDSISDGQNAFTQQVGDVLGWDFSVAALGGIALETNYGYWRNNNGYTNGAITPGSLADLIQKNFGIENIGMEDAFFKLGVPNTSGMPKDELNDYAENYYTEKMDYNFEAGYTPDIVFIFLGTNDWLSSMKDESRFVNAYAAFVEKILAVYGEDTQICVLQALTHSSMPNNEDHPRYQIIRSAAENLMLSFPDNVTFIDRDIITTWNVEIGSDNTHPTGNGHTTLTEKIAALLQEYYN